MCDFSRCKHKARPASDQLPRRTKCSSRACSSWHSLTRPGSIAITSRHTHYQQYNLARRCRAETTWECDTNASFCYIMLSSMMLVFQLSGYTGIDVNLTGKHLSSADYLRSKAIRQSIARTIHGISTSDAKLADGHHEAGVVSTSISIIYTEPRKVTEKQFRRSKCTSGKRCTDKRIRRGSSANYKTFYGPLHRTVICRAGTEAKGHRNVIARLLCGMPARSLLMRGSVKGLLPR